MGDILKNRILSEDEKVFASGVHYAGTKKLCPADLLNLIFSEYYILWNKYKYHQQTRGVPFNNTTPLYLLIVPKDAVISEIADKLAAPLDKKELSKAFAKNIYGNNYRHFLMSFARFATDEDMSACIQKINEKKVGNSKNKYWASNMTAALIYSDTKAAYDYLKANFSLYAYANLRNITIEEANSLFSAD